MTAKPEVMESRKGHGKSRGKSWNLKNAKEYERCIYSSFFFLQISGSLEDYVLLEKLNKMTVTKYSEMSNTAKTLITAMEELDNKCKLTVCTYV